MSREDRLLYVSSLIGEEKAKDAKGGGGRRVTRTPGQYVQAIDEAYGRGDQRPPSRIFEELTP